MFRVESFHYITHQYAGADGVEVSWRKDFNISGWLLPFDLITERINTKL